MSVHENKADRIAASSILTGTDMLGECCARHRAAEWCQSCRIAVRRAAAAASSR